MDPDVERRSGDDVGEVDLDLRNEIRPPRRPAACLARGAEERSPEEGSEDVRQGAQIGRRGEAAAPQPACPKRS